MFERSANIATQTKSDYRNSAVSVSSSQNSILHVEKLLKKM